LTRKTIQDMNRVSHDGGATLVVLFIPFKSQVYFPLLLRSFATADLERYFQFYFRQSPTSLDAKTAGARCGLPATAAHRERLGAMPRTELWRWRAGPMSPPAPEASGWSFFYRAFDRSRMHIQAELLANQLGQLACPDRLARNEPGIEKCQNLALDFVRAAGTTLLRNQA